VLRTPTNSPTHKTAPTTITAMTPLLRCVPDVVVASELTKVGDEALVDEVLEEDEEPVELRQDVLFPSSMKNCGDCHDDPDAMACATYTPAGTFALDQTAGVA